MWQVNKVISISCLAEEEEELGGDCESLSSWTVVGNCRSSLQDLGEVLIHSHWILFPYQPATAKIQSQEITVTPSPVEKQDIHRVCPWPQTLCGERP